MKTVATHKGQENKSKSSFPGRGGESRLGHFPVRPGGEYSVGGGRAGDKKRELVLRPPSENENLGISERACGERGHPGIWKNTCMERASQGQGARRRLLEKGLSERSGQAGRLGPRGAKSESSRKEVAALTCEHEGQKELQCVAGRC